MNNSELFNLAHNIARDSRNDFPTYAAAFASALRGMWHVKKSDLRLLARDNRATVESVLIQWSESGTLSEFEGQTVSFARAEELLALALEERRAYDAEGHKGGYFKTKLTVQFSDGETYEFRLDLNDEEQSITDAFNKRVEYSKTKDLADASHFEHAIVSFWKSFEDKYKLAA